MKFEQSKERNYDIVAERLGLKVLSEKNRKRIGYFNPMTGRFTYGYRSLHRFGNARLYNAYLRLKRTIREI